MEARTPSCAACAKSDGALATAARRYALSFMTMASQGAACNRLHPIEQRAARWLLIVNDRIDRHPFKLTHEFFAMTLGATRSADVILIGAVNPGSRAGLTPDEIVALARRPMRLHSVPIVVLGAGPNLLHRAERLAGVAGVTVVSLPFDVEVVRCVLKSVARQATPA